MCLLLFGGHGSSSEHAGVCCCLFSRMLRPVRHFFVTGRACAERCWSGLQIRAMQIRAMQAVHYRPGVVCDMCVPACIMTASSQTQSMRIISIHVHLQSLFYVRSKSVLCAQHAPLYLRAGHQRSRGVLALLWMSCEYGQRCGRFSAICCEACTKLCKKEKYTDVYAVQQSVAVDQALELTVIVSGPYRVMLTLLYRTATAVQNSNT